MSDISKREQEQKEFIEKFKKLCEEYGFSIGGCGCCGSPWLADDKYILSDITDGEWED